MDRRIREQPLGHLVGAIGGLVGVGGVEVDLEPVGRPEVRQLEPEPFEGLLGRLGLRVEDAPLQADRHRRGVCRHVR